MLTVAALAHEARAASGCGRIRITHVPRFRGHVGFQVDARADVNHYCGSLHFERLEGPPEFDIDGAGGLFYWTPARPGIERITIQVTETTPERVTTARKRLRVTVDDDTLVTPLFRDYLSQAATVPIVGRAHGLGFSWYKLEYSERDQPDVKHVIAGPVRNPVEATGLLASWNAPSSSR
jgi:hypothetical protein